MNDVVSINEGLCTEMVRNGKIKLLHSYAIVVYLTRGLGYMIKRDLVQQIQEFAGVKERTAWIYLRNLEKEGMIVTKNTHHKGEDRKLATVHVRSKKKVALEYTKDTDSYTNVNIKFSVNQIKTYNDFRNRYIRMTHLKLQNAFRYSYQKIKRNTHSLVKSGEIDPDSCPDSIDKVGCSIRKVCEHTNLSYQTVQKSLKGYTKTTGNLVADFDSYKDFRKVYDMNFFKKNRKYVFGKKNGRIYVFYLLGSVSSYCSNSTT